MTKSHSLRPEATGLLFTILSLKVQRCPIKIIRSFDPVRLMGEFGVGIKGIEMFIRLQMPRKAGE